MGQHFDILKPLIPTAQLSSRKLVLGMNVDMNVHVAVPLLKAESVSYISKLSIP